MEDETVSNGAMKRVVVSEALTSPVNDEIDATVEMESVVRRLLLPVICNLIKYFFIGKFYFIKFY